MKQFSKNLPPSLQTHLEAALNSGDFLDAEDYLRFLLRRESRTPGNKDKAEASLLEFASALRGHENIEDFCELAVENLAKSLDWLYASIYVRQGDWFKKKASYGARGGIPLFKPEEGQIGQVVRSQSPLLVNNLPDYARLQFGLGKLSPAHLLLYPVVYRKQVLAVVELGGLRALTETQLCWLDQAAKAIAPGLRLALELEEQQDRAARVQTGKAWDSALFSQFSGSLIITEPCGHILDMNLAAESLYGWTRAELLGQHINTLTPAKRHRQVMQLLARSLAGEKVLAVSCQGIDKRGRSFSVDLTLSPLLSKDGETTAIAFCASDTAERRATEAAQKMELDFFRERLANCQDELKAELAKSQAQQLQLSSAVLAKSDILQKLELRLSKPLQSLQSSLDGLDRTERLWRSRALTLSALVETQNLSFPSQEGGLTLDCQDFDIEELLADVRDIHQGYLATAELELHFDISPTCPRYLRGDRPRLTQILVNLLANVAEHSSSKSATVCLETISQQNKKIGLQFSVQDSGVGLTAKHQKSLLSQEIGGLAICQRLARLMAGNLQLESKKGKGATFRFQAFLERAQDMGEESRPEYPPQRLLLIDHNKTTRDTLKKLLEYFGHEVLIARSGPQGLSLYTGALRDDKPVDVVILDWDLPGMGGADVSQQIQETNPEQRMVLLAGTNPESVRERGQELNLNSLLRKPVIPGEIQLVLK